MAAAPAVLTARRAWAASGRGISLRHDNLRNPPRWVVVHYFLSKSVSVGTHCICSCAARCHPASTFRGPAAAQQIRKLLFSGVRRRVKTRSHQGLQQSVTRRRRVWGANGRLVPIVEPPPYRRRPRRQFRAARSFSQSRWACRKRGPPSVYAWCLSQTAVCTTTEHALCVSRMILSADDGYQAQGTRHQPQTAAARAMRRVNAGKEVNGVRVNGSLMSSGTILDDFISLCPDLQSINHKHLLPSQTLF